MNVSTEKSKSNINRPRPVSALLHNFPGVLERLIRFFTLTEEDRLKAGVNLRGEGRDD